MRGRTKDPIDQRHVTVKAAIVFDRGVVTADDLARMSPVEFDQLRARAADRSVASSSYSPVTCGMCGGPLHVHAPFGAVRHPFFKHRSGADRTCQWYSGNVEDLDAVRGKVHQGIQEGRAHRAMCSLIKELIDADPRVKNESAVNAHLLDRTGTRFGRYPDVQFSLPPLGDFAIEVQFHWSPLIEIAERAAFYASNNRHLIYVLGGFDPSDRDQPQHFRDLIERHRGNAFVLDSDAIRLSRIHGRLVLTCFRQTAGSWVGRPFGLDDLHYRAGGQPFLVDDRLIERKRQTDELRERTVAVLRRIRSEGGPRHYDSPLPIAGLTASESWRLMAVAYSIYMGARMEHEFNLANGHVNLQGVLNSHFGSYDGRRQVELLWPIIFGTRAALHVGKKSRPIMERALDEAEQLSYDDAAFEMLKGHFPEVYDPEFRDDLTAAGLMPDWAMSVAADTKVSPH